MRQFTVVLCALLAITAGCTQTAPSTEVQTTMLLEKYRTDEPKPRATVLFFITQGCPPNMRSIRDFLQGLENLSDGGVKFIEVNAEIDKEGKKAYGVISFPTVLFFSEAGELKDRRGPDLDMETAKKIVTDLGVAVREIDAETETPKK